MKKHISHLKTGRYNYRLLTLAGAVMVSILAVFGALSMPQRAHAETADSYCAQYTSNSKINACKSGLRGQDCSDYAITFDQATADVCTQASKAKSSGRVTDLPSFNASDDGSSSTDQESYRNIILNACAPYQSDTAATTACLYGGLGKDGKGSSPQTTNECLTKQEFSSSSKLQGACITGVTSGQSYLAAKNGGTDDPSSSNNFSSTQDILDQTNNLSSYVDMLHALGPDAGIDTSKEADNNYGSYVNGAGKQQPIKVYPCANAGEAAKQTTTQTDSVIKDATGKQVGSISSTSTSGGCPAILMFNGGGWHSNDNTSEYFATGSGNKNGDQNMAMDKPAGGGANERGYTVLDVSYRLGSSGVYYMFEDVMRGIQHVRSNAGMYGIDASKIAIMGDSAGGSLSLRAGSSGKSGAKVMVGWSAPTNAYTALFKSFKSFMIGMDHSTCVPTDLAGMTNMTDLLNGGSGNVAEYGQGLSSNDFSSLGIGGDGGGTSDPLSIVTQVLTAGQYAAKTGQNVESISQQLQASKDNPMAMSGSVINLSAKKLIECTDNFNVLSPALFASPDSPPGYLAGFDNDDLIDPQQLYDMRDKLLGMGIKADALVIPGDPEAAANAPALGASSNHLGYDPRFVCPTINFIDETIQPDKGKVECTKPVQPPAQSASNGCATSVRISNAPRSSNIRLTAVVPPGTHPVGQGHTTGDPALNGVYKFEPNAPTQSSGPSAPATSSGSGCNSGSGNGNSNSGSSNQNSGTSYTCTQTVALKSPPVIKDKSEGQVKPPVFNPDPGPRAEYMNPAPRAPSTTGTGCVPGGTGCVKAVSIRLADVPPCPYKNVPLSTPVDPVRTIVRMI